MLSDTFLDWWFAPWTYATDRSGGVPAAADQLGQRDGYRLWCESAGIASAFPARFDPEWQIVVSGSGELIAAARLFAGLFAARLHNQAALSGLPFEDRKWCMSVATTQPLVPRYCKEFGTADGLEVRGLVELAHRLELEFSGLWPRLRLVLPVQLAARVDVLLQEVQPAKEERFNSSVRVRRCWMLCSKRAATSSHSIATSTAWCGLDEKVEEALMDV